MIYNRHNQITRKVMKRALDLVVALPAVVLLFPLMLVTALAIRLMDGHSALFVQKRPGLHGKPFRMYKFRTMRQFTSPEGVPLPDEQRVTRLGVILRETSLDELPSLFNVIKGEMSLVGPRPLLMEYLPNYTPFENRRHEVKPGVTGWAQVNGRNEISWKEKFRYDVWYADHGSFWLDLKILGSTVVQVLMRKGNKGSAFVSRYTEVEKS